MDKEEPKYQQLFEALDSFLDWKIEQHTRIKSSHFTWPSSETDLKKELAKLTGEEYKEDCDLCCNVPCNCEEQHANEG